MIDKSFNLQSKVCSLNKEILRLKRSLESKEREDQLIKVELSQLAHKDQELTNLLVNCSVKIDSTIELLNDSLRKYPEAGRIIQMLSFLQDRLKEEVGFTIKIAEPKHSPVLASENMQIPSHFHTISDVHNDNATFKEKKEQETTPSIPRQSKKRRINYGTLTDNLEVICECIQTDRDVASTGVQTSKVQVVYSSFKNGLLESFASVNEISKDMSEPKEAFEQPEIVPTEIMFSKQEEEPVFMQKQEITTLDEYGNTMENTKQNATPAITNPISQNQTLTPSRKNWRDESKKRQLKRYIDKGTKKTLKVRAKSKTQGHFTIFKFERVGKRREKSSQLIRPVTAPKKSSSVNKLKRTIY